MASAPLPSAAFEEEDNEFDWEAAVREIDSACQGASASTSGRADLASSGLNQRARGSRSSKPGGSDRGPRQTTLDCFVGSRGTPDNGLHGSGYAPLGDHHGGDQPSSVSIDLDAAKTWIYPVNVPLRDYQFSITKTALFSNTLVALPTGLGKTLIAAVVMYNFFRWFPEGKIVFAAPSRPLVMQQIEACHNTVGIPQEWAIDMTGQLNPQKRSQFWNSKRVFFVTPQVLEKDILSGICPVKQLTCLVIDEAHRAMGNYSYCVAVRELMSVPVQLRILALTATPGSKQKTIQNVIDNLCMSTLEYRNESNKDVSPYVHSRKIELVEVSMCKNTVAINNILLEVIRPFASRLCSLGVLWCRDFASLNPCELLNSRDKFRQAPPANLPLPKYGEVEGYFGVLITLYHIRKLLSSHGIRPAYDMLEEKLKQGSFSRLMSRNEAIWDAKRLMQQSLSHGAPNPKLEKIKEVLMEHFKTKNPKESRVIIFSNFRGSVKDIMHSLSDVGGVINATEFVGQSSGKALKGQTQKVQQAVLQKFRSGVYNVIVATSIGEEGLDIMEVDLVICFDANISPLRMIQRMGRTGRKHDGRVVVLACEGSEVKGYLKKQANGKIIGKHMHNGGIKSFDFHPSPRMVPHMCRPQVQFVELSIEQFVPRGKKMEDVLSSRSPVSKKISEEEKGVISRYFNSSEGGTWKPSLIAFPRFQAFTSRVYRVSHSHRTTLMLIDAMQRLQGFSFNDKENHSCEMNVHEEIQAHEDDHGKVEDLEFGGSQKASSEEREVYDLPPRDNSSLHSFLFNKDFVNVGTRGCVSISSVPVLSFINGSPCIQELENIDSKTRSLHEGHPTSPQMPTLDSPMGKSTSDPPVMEFRPLFTNSVDLPNMKFSPRMTRPIEDGSPIKKSTPTLPDLEFSPRLTHFIEKGSLVRKSTSVDLPEMELSPRMTQFIEKGSPVRKSTPDIHDMEFSPQVTRFIEKGTPIRKSMLDLPEMEFSPRLTHFIEKGIVPESPTVNNNTYHPVPEEILEKIISPALVNAELPPGSPSPSKIEIVRVEKTPVATHSKNSSSEGWQLGSTDALKSVHQTPKFKRLRRHRDFVRKLPCKVLEENFHSQVKQFCQRISKKKPELAKRDKGKTKAKVNLRHFIEEEAEVSSDARGSDDEDEGSDESQYDDSFIDDEIGSAETNTRAGNSGNDVMAFYRRSLLTQSPGAMRSPLFPANSADESFSPGSCSSEKIAISLHTPRTTDNCRIGSPLLNSRTLNLDENDETSQTMGEIRKEKLSFSLVDLETGQGQTSSDALTAAVLSDDEFYEGLDLDAVEAQAAELLRTKMPVGLNSRVDQCPDEDFAASPSFDLGI